MDELYIAEKPTVGRAIADSLGGKQVPVRGSKGTTHILVGANIVVTWVFGHILELAEPEDYDPVFATGNWADCAPHLPINPENDWKLKVVGTAKEQMAVIRDLAKRAVKIVHAGDPDREGQLLVDEVLEFLNNKVPVSRILPNAIDKASMAAILANVKDNKQYRGLYEAGLGRQRADWLVGMNLTRAMSIANQRGGMRGTLSVGRVQTPTLALVVKRDLEIENFESQTYFDPKALFKHQKGQFIGSWKAPAGFEGLDSEGRLTDPVAASALEQKCKDQPARIVNYSVDDRKKAAPLPFSLSALQIKASSQFKMSAEQVLEICQALYEAKITSYPRSDCQYLPESQHEQAPQVLAALAKFDLAMAGLAAGANPKLQSRAWDTKKVSAHHALIPTSEPNYGSMTEPQRKVFGLIARQYLAQFYPDYTFKQTLVLAECAGYEFKASGSTPIDPGWKRVLGAEEPDEKEKGKESDKEQLLPPMSSGDPLTCVTIKSERKQTKAPSRYTEGTLIRAMTNVHETVTDPAMKKRLELVKGIGTEATRAKIISKLKKRHFVFEEKGAIISTRQGRELIEALPRELTDVALTASWENALDSVERGAFPLAKFLEGQGKWIRVLTKQALEKEISIGLGFDNSEVSETVMGAYRALQDRSCPQCKVGQLRPVQATKGDNAGKYFLGCSNYPECKHTVEVAGQEDAEKRRGGGARKKTTTRT